MGALAFRVQGIPAAWNWKSLAGILTEWAEQTDKDEAAKLLVTGKLYEAPYSDLNTQSAIIQFPSAVPSYLVAVAEDKTAQQSLHRRVTGTDTILSIDKHFAGMTPLYSPPNEAYIHMEYDIKPIPPLGVN